MHICHQVTESSLKHKLCKLIIILGNNKILTSDVLNFQTEESNYWNIQKHIKPIRRNIFESQGKKVKTIFFKKNCLHKKNSASVY